MKIFYLDVIDKNEIESIDDEAEEQNNYELIDLNMINHI